MLSVGHIIKSTGGKTAARGTRKLFTPFRLKPGMLLAFSTYYFPLTTLYSRQKPRIAE
jgi:hypothetical protein